MTYLLSLLDRAPVEAGATAADVLAAAVKLAVAAEELGYHDVSKPAGSIGRRTRPHRSACGDRASVR
ncbi:hypothetical protein AS026_13295 [Rhizobium altiplani]|uniref:Uncharacterized protein n=1 Tax=Rhizobium altiplani TaxID=1864509 RepID=A0A109JF46_9HYPH|nr:hypothetical protein [Rhizobium altiplani]KWV47743.1 hypothetical protein AS026_13295 [Rhizobium altiplani]